MAYSTWDNSRGYDEYNKYCKSDVNYEFHKPNPDAAISMMAGGADEMIRVTRDGFWVRGVRVPQDDKEAETVYNAFKQWMAWAALQQRR
jgi:hypothetical protein